VSASRLPTFLIVGAMRSGTTSLARYLGAHPDVHVAPEKEIHYFDRYYERGAGWYATRFRANGESVVGEATANYMYDPSVPSRVAADLPGAKILAILRDPVDRAYSHYWMSRARAVETLGFDDALDAEAERIRDGGDGARRTFSYVDRGRYASQLERLCGPIPRDALCVLFFEELRDDAEAQYQALCAWLGIDDSFVPDDLGRPINPHTRYRSATLRRRMRALPRPLGRIVARANGYPARYEPMDPMVRERLEDVFSPDDQALAEWLGRDLPWSRAGGRTRIVPATGWERP
jgi:hypothetical protein